MSLVSTTLRPGLLVGMSTSIKGNVDHEKTMLEEEHVTEAGELRSRWETERVVLDAVEMDAATKVRSKARSLITGICAKSDFGYLCPDNKIEALEAAIREANTLCTDFNLTSKLTEVNFFTITGRIAADDMQAVRAIKSELNGLLEEMDAGIKALDVTEVRKVAIRAKKLGSMLTPDAQARLQSYIETVRATATKISAAGDQAAEIVDEEVLKDLAGARTAFLDLDGASALKESEAVGRAVDLDPDVTWGREEPLTTQAEEPAREIDLEDMLG